MRLRREDGQAVAGRHEQAPRHDHVAVAVAIRGGAEIGRVRPGHQLHELMGMNGIGIGMMAAEIGKRHVVDDSARRGAQPAFQDGFRVRPGDRAQRVEAHA